MLPNEILAKFRKNMFIHSYRFIKQINVNNQNVYNLFTIASNKKFTLELYSKDINISNFNKLYKQIPNRYKIYSKEKFYHSAININHRRREKNLHVSYTNNNKTEKVSNQIHDWLYTDTENPPDISILKKFSEPKQILNQICNTVKKDLKLECLSSSFTKNQKWICTYTLTWPQYQVFQSQGLSKASASSSAALKCIYWLHLIKRLKNNLPIIYNEAKIKSSLKAPKELKIENSVLKEIVEFLDQYEFVINKNIANSSIYELEKQEYLFENPNFHDQHPISIKSEDMDYRNKYLKTKLKDKTNFLKLDLPIFNYKSQILEELEKNQALVLKGDTGCGKSTHVPQFILDHMAENNLGSNCNIIVTQPRRISVISLAERVAYERNESLGNVIGYQVRLNQLLPNKNGAILFCTTGILLKKLQANPELKGCSHVIVDEAHQRSIDIDILLLLLKRAMEKNSSLKVIIMSATLNADLFQEYFKCKVLDIPGRLFSVQMNLLEDIKKLNLSFPYLVDYKEDDKPLVNHQLISDLIRWISKNKPPGAILCFLPGWSDISNIEFKLKQNPIPDQILIRLHSRLTCINQNLVYTKLPPFKRKIILATDIAETGITIPDVVYVIDSACHKVKKWNERKNLTFMSTEWISRATLHQRKGRAGRIRNGESYHLISNKLLDNLKQYPTPEICHTSLEKIILDSKVYSNEKATIFLGSMIQPPKISSIINAVYNLQMLEAMDQNENLTPLGKKLIFFSVEPKLSKAIVYSSLFQCFEKMLVIVSSLSMNSRIFYEYLEKAKFIRKKKLSFHSSSDHISIVNIYEEWKKNYFNNSIFINEYCRNNFLAEENMLNLHHTIKLHCNEAVNAGLIKLTDELNIKENSYKNDDELLLGILLASTSQLLEYRDSEIRKGRLICDSFSFVTEGYKKALISSTSVNYKRKLAKSSYLTYFNKFQDMNQSRALISDSSVILPITALLFSQGEIFSSKYEEKECESNNVNKVLLTIDRTKNLRLICDKCTANNVLRFRNVMWSIIRYFIQHTNKQNNQSNELNEMNIYKMKMIKILLKMIMSKQTDSMDLK